MDSETLNHMSNHGEWFKDTRDLKTSRFVEIGDDIRHPITQLTKYHYPCKMSKQSI